MPTRSAGGADQDTPAEPASCPRCDAPTLDATWERYRVCSGCGYHAPLGARERVDLLVDPGSFQETARGLSSSDPLLFRDRVSYRERLEGARAETGLQE